MVKKILVFLTVLSVMLGLSGFVVAVTQGVEASVQEGISILITPQTISFGSVTPGSTDNPDLESVGFNPAGSNVDVRVAVSSVSTEPFTSGLQFDNIYLSTNPFYDMFCIVIEDVCTYTPTIVEPTLDVATGTPIGPKLGVITYTVTAVPD